MAKRQTKRKRKTKRKSSRKDVKFSKAIRHSNDKFIRQIVSRVRKLRTKKLPPKMMKVVKDHAKQLHSISDPKVSLKRKRKLLVQKGGFVFRMLSMIDPVAWMVDKFDESLHRRLNKQ